MHEKVGQKKGSWRQKKKKVGAMSENMGKWDEEGETETEWRRDVRAGEIRAMFMKQSGL